MEELLQKSLADTRGKTVVVAGDVMLDHYTFGDVERISPEAPVPVFRARSDRMALGGAANVAANLASLGIHVLLLGVTGTDHQGSTVRGLLEEHDIGHDGVLEDPSRPTTVKHRFVHGTHHQLLRVDHEETFTLREELRDELSVRMEDAVAHADVVILSDYGKGLFSKQLVERTLAAAKKKGIKVLADIKPVNMDIFTGVDLVTPNLKEGKEMTGQNEIEAIGKALVGRLKADIFLTRSEDGISVFSRADGLHNHIPGKKIKVSDVSGAGDTALAIAAVGIAAGMDLLSAATLANAAAAIVVQKAGTATLTWEELLSALQDQRTIETIAIVPKLWGYEKWLENNDKYCSKLLSLNKGYQCSLHYHKIKDETFIVTQGHVRLEVEDKVYHLREGGFIRIPPGTKHRFAGIEDSLIIEVSTHHREEDSYRIEESRKMAEI